jgi:AbrB family looped-hinge helix DNA binding protein
VVITDANGISLVAWPHGSVIDTRGRVVLPKQLRDAVGLTPGTKVDVSAYGGGIQIVPRERTARLLRDENGRLVAQAVMLVTDETMSALMDSGRR